MLLSFFIKSRFGIKNFKGRTLALEQPLQLNALPYSPAQLYSGPRKGQENSGLLEPDAFIHLHIDHRQMGVGGINSWGTLPLEAYRVPVQRYAYRYLIRPLFY